MTSSAQFEARFFGAARWVVVAALALVTVVPFLYMLVLSLKPVEALLKHPGALWVSGRELTLGTYRSVLEPVSAGARASCGCCSTPRRWPWARWR